MRKLLFVCSGNTCRSPLALAAWRALQTDGKAPRDVEADSAGLVAAGGDPASSHSIALARNWQQDLSAHRSQPLTPELAQSAEWLVVMDSSHALSLYEFPGVERKKVDLLASFDKNTDDGEILDPFGGSREAYETCAVRIRRAVEGLAAAIESGKI